MADYEHGALVVHEEILKPDDALQIEVVRGLVEQDYVRLAEERLCQQHLDLQPAVQVGHHSVVVLRVHAEAVQYSASVALGLPAAQLGVLLLELAGTDAVFIGEVRLLVDGVLLFADVVEALVAHYDSVHNRVLVVHALVLLEHAHAGLGVYIHRAGSALHLAGQHTQECTLPCSVRADNTIAVARSELQVGIRK